MVVMPVSPTHLFIPAIGLNTSISPGLSSWQPDKHTGRTTLTFPVPADMTTVTWWQGGPDALGNNVAAPMPGSSGVAIMTMHSSLDNRGYGVGNRLGELHKGQRIGVEGKDISGSNTLDTFNVLGVKTSLNKADPDALHQAILAAPPGTRLIFITCSGTANYAISSSNFNTLVYAEMIGSSKV